jgi:Ca2+-binding EF-hand superfamily protein
MVSGISGSNFGAEAMEAMRQNRFKKIDQDGDGKISKDELKAGMPQNGKGPSVDDIFSKVDTNQDSVIDEAEDKAAFEQMRKNPPPGGPPGAPPDASTWATQLFKKADADADGKITMEELSAALPRNTKGLSVDDLLKAMDSDNDSAISKSELETAIQKMMEQRQASFPSPEQSGTDGYDRTGGNKGKSATSLFSTLA